MSTVSKVHTFHKGLNKDLNTNNISNEHLTDALNATLMSDATDQYAFTNEKGTSKICNLPNSTLIGRHVLENETVLFFTDGNIHEIGVVENNIYKPYVVNNTIAQTVTTYKSSDNTYSTWNTEDNLNFNVNNPIKIRWRKIFNNNRNIYFVDGLNVPRTINLDDLPAPTDINTNPSILDQFSLFSATSTPKVEYVEQLEFGNLEVGSYQFLVQYLDDKLNESLYSLATTPIPVVSYPRSVGRNNYIGAQRGTNASKSIVLDVSNIDLDFKFIQLIAVKYSGIGDTITADVVDRKEITGTTMQFVYGDKDTSIKTIDLTSLASSLPGYISAGAIQDKDNILTLGDLKTLPVQNLQSIVNKLNLKYRVKELQYTDIVKTSKQIGSSLVNSFGIASTYVLETAVDTINIEMTKLLTTVNIDDVSLIKVVVTDQPNPALPHTVTYTRLVPTTVITENSTIKATFSGNDFTDTSLYNFSDTTILHSTDPNHVPLYFIVLGNETATPAGGTVGAPIQAADGDLFNYISNVYVGQSTVSTMTNTDPSDVVLASGLDITVGDSVAIYGKAYTTEVDGLYTVTTVISATDFSVDVFTTYSETVGGPIFSKTDQYEMSILPSIIAANAGGYLINNSYFGDYVDEKNVADFKTRKRGEAYSFAVRFRFNNGGVTPFFHIPGNNRVSSYDSAIPDNNRLAAIPDLPDVDTRKDNSTGYLGTYISNEKYSTNSGLPTDYLTGSDYSNGSNVRHHIMPTLKDEPIVRYDEDTKTYFIRILGVFPIYIDSNGFEKTIEDFIQEFSGDLVGIVGYEFGVQSRELSNNKSIICQGIAQPLQYVQGADLGQRMTNHPFAGKTKVYTGTRVLPYMINNMGNDFGHITNTYNTDIPYVCQFYSPDVLLNNTRIPTGSKIKPVAAVKGDVSTVALSYPQPSNRLSQTRSGLIHMFYNYNDFYSDYDLAIYKNDSASLVVEDLFAWNKLQEAYLNPVTILSTGKLMGTDNVYGNDQIPEYPTLPVYNYLNEGYTYINLGRTNGLPRLVETDDNDFTITIAINKRSSGTSTTYDISSNPSPLTNYYHSKQSARLLYDVVVDLSSQYGSLFTSQYTVCGEYSIGEGNTFEKSTFYKGDTFISKCSFRNSYGFSLKYRHNNNDYTKLASARATGVDYAVGEEWNTLFYCWFESDVNCNYRYIGVDDKGNSLQPEFPANPTISQLTTGRGATRPVLPISAGEKNIFDRGGVLDTSFNITESNRYNTLHSAKDIINIGFGLPIAFEDVNTFPNRIIYSTVAVEGEVVDAYKKFLANNYHDIPKDKGKIEMMFVQGGTYYIHTKYTLYKAFFNESVSLPTSTEEIYLGNGGVFSRPSIELLDIDGGYAGCQSVWGSVDTPFGRFFIDTNQSKLFLLAGGSIQQVNSGINRFLQNELSISNYIDNPFIYKGLVAAYDYNFDRLIITKHDSSNSNASFTLSYYPQIKNFFSYHSYLPNVIYTVGGKINIYSDALKELHGLGTGEYGVYFNNRYNTELEIVTNNNLTETAYDNLVVKSVIADEAIQAVKHYDFFDEYSVKNDTCNSDVIPLTKDVTYKFKRDGFTLAYPRNAVVDPFINVNDPTNVDKNRKFLPRITGKYVRTRFIYKNLNNYKLTVNYIVSLFRPIAR